MLGDFVVKVKKDLTGMVFGRLTVLEQAEDYINPNGKHYAQWLCQCNCGSNPKIVKQENLKNGTTKSCGCLHLERATQIAKKFLHKTNKYDLSGDYGIGWTSNTNEEFYCDLADYDKIKDYYWHEDIHKDGLHTLRTYIPDTKKSVYMHVLLGYKNYDHIDRNELNNRKSNLRPATASENTTNRRRFKNNTSGYTGVVWHKQTQKWRAQIQINKKPISLGAFNTKDEAVVARLKAEVKYHGDFASQKYLYEQYGIISEGDENDDSM